MQFFKSLWAFVIGVKYILSRGSPFAVFSALWPPNEEGKYVIQAEGVRLALTNHGAAPTNFWINDTYGRELDIILGLDHADEYPKLRYNPYLNGAIGRYAGFMSNASYEYDGERVQLEANALNASVLFNGGANGWGRQTWDVAVHTDNSITFLLFDRMWNGFPGIFAACLTHTVTPYEWKIAFGVTPLIRATPLDLSHTVFFNLDGFEPDSTTGKKDILDHSLYIPSAGMRFGVDDHGVPTGELLSNKKEEEYDFWSSPHRTIGDGLKQKSELPQQCQTLGGRECGYDEIFLLSHEEMVRKDVIPSAILSGARSGISLELFSDRGALHIHTWNERNGALNLKASQGKGGVPQHAAISLEMRDWPDAINQPQWRNKKSIFGMEGLYTYFATYKFLVK